MYDIINKSYRLNYQNKIRTKLLFFQFIWLQLILEWEKDEKGAGIGPNLKKHLFQLWSGGRTLQARLHEPRFKSLSSRQQNIFSHLSRRWGRPVSDEGHSPFRKVRIQTAAFERSKGRLSNFLDRCNLFVRSFGEFSAAWSLFLNLDSALSAKRHLLLNTFPKNERTLDVVNMISFDCSPLNMDTNNFNHLKITYKCFGDQSC